MFTGIVEAIGRVEEIIPVSTNYKITISAPFTNELKIDQSVAHDGCCLTVVEIHDNTYVVQAIDETLTKTNLKNWVVGSRINLERGMKIQDRLDGHIVQGHVDGVGTLMSITNKSGSYYLTFSYESTLGFVTVPQGSITINGVSLTVADSQTNQFSVAIIPYTWEYTNLSDLQVNAVANLEFDIIGKYVAQLMNK